jgi:hypothetical protein
MPRNGLLSRVYIWEIFKMQDTHGSNKYDVEKKHMRVGTVALAVTNFL